MVKERYLMKGEYMKKTKFLLEFGNNGEQLEFTAKDEKEFFRCMEFYYYKNKNVSKKDSIKILSMEEV